jgi:uncharacterized integral membrane protein (TIGR00698 family)
VQPKREGIFDNIFDTGNAGMLQSLGSMEGELVFEPVGGGKSEGWWPGVLAAAVVTLLSWGLLSLPFPPFTLEGGRHPLGLSVLAMLVGMMWGTFGHVPTKVLPGLRWAVGSLIPVAIVLLGARIDARLLGSVAVGWWAGVPVLMSVAFFGTFAIGRLLGLGKALAALLGVGTAVCGSSAILALAPILVAKKEDVVLSVGVINLAGLLAMVVSLGVMALVPMQGPLVGYWAGASVQAVPQAIAVAESHGGEAAGIATMVKLTRVMFLAPVILVAGILVARKKQSGNAKSKRPFLGQVPWFVWGFAIMVALRSLGYLPTMEFESTGHRFELAKVFAETSKWLLAISLAAIGMQIKMGSLIAQRGTLAVLGTGVLGWLVLSAAALLLGSL